MAKKIKTGPEIYNEKRRILFSTFHKGGKSKDLAFDWLEGYKHRGTLDTRGYTGLKAELGFYRNYKKEMGLVFAGDAGDHTDFSAVLEGKQFRIDVTTNIDFKKLKDYEPLQREDDDKYKIALVNEIGELVEMIDINYPFCPECGEGRLIDTTVLCATNHNEKGDCLWDQDQQLIGICNYCQYFEFQQLITSSIKKYGTEIDDALEYERSLAEDEFPDHENRKIDVDHIIASHTDGIVPYLNNAFKRPLMAIGDYGYKVTDPDGDGHYILKNYYRKNFKFLDEYILDEYEIEL
jgi:hypothetical protein